MPRGIKKHTYTGYQGKKQAGGGTKKSYAKSKYTPPRKTPRRKTSAGPPGGISPGYEPGKGRQGAGSRPYSYANPNLFQRLRNFWWRMQGRYANPNPAWSAAAFRGLKAGLTQNPLYLYENYTPEGFTGAGGGYRSALEQRRKAAVARRQTGGGRVSAESRPYGYVQEQYSPYYGYEEVMGFPEEGYTEYPVEYPYEEYPGYGLASYPYYGGGGGGYKEKNRVAYPYARAEAPMGGATEQMPRYAYQPQIEMPRWYQNLVNWQF